MSGASPIPAERLRTAMTVRKLDVSTLAQEAGVGINTVLRALSDRPISLETRLRLSVVLANHKPDPELGQVLSELGA